MKNFQIRLIVVSALSTFMFTVDYSMLNISLPTISRYFNVGVANIARLPMVYLLIVTSSLLGFGKLGDIKGYRKVFIGGVAVFLAGSLLSTIAPTINMLLAARIVQSVGEAMFSPVALALLTTFLPSEMRGRALGIVATAQASGLAIGNLAGGFITSHFVWRFIFLVNVPVALFTIFLALRTLPAEQPQPSDKRFDTKGALLIFVTLASLLYALNSMGRINWNVSATAASFAIFITALILFIFQERKVAYPLLDPRLLKNKGFAYSNLSAFFLVCVVMGFGFLAPFYLQIVRSMDVMHIGAALMIPSVMMMVFAPLSGRFSDIIGSRVLCSVGTALATVSCVMFSLIVRNSSFLFILLSLFILGVAAGIFLPPNNKLVMSHAPGEKQGVASGIYKICLNIGAVFGIALFPFVIIQTILRKIAHSNIDIAQARQTPAIMQEGFHAAFVFGIFICLLAFLASVFAKDKQMR